MKHRFGAAIFSLSLLFAAQAHAAEPLSCPAGFYDKGVRHTLERINIFEGPQEKKADLAPKHGGWNLVDYRRDDGELFLVCHYKKSGVITVLMIPHDAKTCRLKSGNAFCD